MIEYTCMSCYRTFETKDYIVGSPVVCDDCKHPTREQRIESMCKTVLEQFDREGFTTPEEVSGWVVELATQIIDKIDGGKK